MSRVKKFVLEKGYYDILEIRHNATTIDIQRQACLQGVARIGL